MKLETIGKNIDAIRKQRGYTIDELARRMGISATSMSRHIKGHTVPEMRLIIKYAEVLGCKVGDLVDEAVDRTAFVIQTDITHTYPYNIACAIAQSGQEMDARLDAAWDVYVPGLIEAIESCTEREQRVLELRFKNAMSLDEVGERFNVTRERIRQVEAKALRRLRAKKGMWSITERQERAKRAFESELETLMEKLLEKEEGEVPESESVCLLHKEDPHASIEEPDISIRLFNCLKRAGVQTVDDIQFLTESEMARVRGFGVGCSEELKKLMKKYGVSFLVVSDDASDIGQIFSSPSDLIAMRKNGIRNAADILEDRKDPSPEELPELRKKAEGFSVGAHLG